MQDGKLNEELLFLPRPRNAVSINGEFGAAVSALETCARVALITVALSCDDSVYRSGPVRVATREARLTRVDSFSVVSLPSSKPRSSSMRDESFLMNIFKFDFRLLTVRY